MAHNVAPHPRATAGWTGGGRRRGFGRGPLAHSPWRRPTRARCLHAPPSSPGCVRWPREFPATCGLHVG
eukprot:8367969-Alexandrium_andersonii.AAC.1